MSSYNMKKMIFLSVIFVGEYVHFRTSGAWLLVAFTFPYTFRTAGAADLVILLRFLEVR